MAPAGPNDKIIRTVYFRAPGSRAALPHGLHPHRTPESRRQDDARPGAHHREQRSGDAARGAHGPARGRCRPAGGARLHRPRERQGARRRRGGFAHARPGAGGHRQPRTRRHHGRRRGRHQPRRAAAGGDPDGRPAGCGQDHDDGQAGQAPDRQAQEEGADRLGRRVPPGGHRAAQDRHEAGRRGMVPVLADRQAAGHRRGRARPCQAPLFRRAAGRHRRATGHRRGADEGDRRTPRRAEPGRDAVRRRRDAGP
jgi:hypothetical protein